MADAKKKKPPRPNWSGAYHVLRDGREIAVVNLLREWTSAGPKYTVTVDGCLNETFTDPGYAMQRALKLVAPGEMVWPWYNGCATRGLRLRAEGKAPWEPVPEEQEACHAR